MIPAPQNLLWYDAAQIIAMVFIVAGLIWNLKLSISLKAGLDTVTALCNKIITNDLEHIRQDITNLRNAFTEHLQYKK